MQATEVLERALLKDPHFYGVYDLTNDRESQRMHDRKTVLASAMVRALSEAADGPFVVTRDGCLRKLVIDPDGNYQLRWI